MKTRLLSLSFAILSLLACASCKKGDDVSADVAAEVTGTYQVQYAYGNGTTLKLPTSDTNAGVTFTRISNTDVSLVYAFTSPGTKFVSSPYTYQVQRNGKTYEIRSNNRKTGTVEDNTLKMDVVNPDGSAAYIEAVRR